MNNHEAYANEIGGDGKAETDRIRCEAGGPLPLTQEASAGEFWSEGIKQASDVEYPMLGAADHESFCQKKLKEAGLDGEYKVEVATDHTIQLDFDIPFEQMLPKQFFDALEIFARMLDKDQFGNPLPEPKTAMWRHLKSRSGRSHVIIDLSWDMPQAERIAWQAAMGSDFKREALSLAYAAQGQHAPVLLYSRKEEAALYVPILPPMHP
jgi:hypothetical protein